MRTAAILTSFALALTAVVATAADQQSDLSGTWVATRNAPTTSGLAPNALFGDRFNLVVTADQVVLTRPVRGNAASMVTTLPLAGTEVPVVQRGRQCFGDSIQTVSATRRDVGFDYVIVSNTAAGGATTTPGLTYRFRPEGDALVVESVPRDGSGVKPVGTVYQRTADTLPPPLTGPNVTVAPATIDALGWLVGDWRGTVGGNNVEERWMPAAGGAMIGTSRSTRGTSMVEFEFLCIAQRAGGLVYTAMPNGGGTTDFLSTKVSSNSVTFENPAHDFPRSIVYTRNTDGGIDVVVAGAPGQRVLTYSFAKK
jgi:hypothetical protein